MTITTTQHIPRSIWSWRSSALVLLLVLAPVTGLAIVAAHERNVVDAAHIESVITAPATLIAALAFYVAWRILADRSLGWVSLALTIIACQVVITTGLQLAAAASGPANRGWSTIADITVLQVVIVCAALARRCPLPVDPAAVGFLIGLGLAPARLISSTMLPDPPIGTVAPAVTYAAALTVTGVLLMLIDELPLWLRTRLVLAIVLISSANLVMMAEGPLPAMITITLDTLGSVALVSAALPTLRIAAAAAEQEHHELERRLEEVQATAREDHARMHEIGATLAGITSASSLIAQGARISEQRRQLLEDMMRAELARLQRLVAPPQVGHLHVPRPRTVDLDETIGRLAVAHEARGSRVQWRPCGQLVDADPDAVTEVINILLDNAAKHGASEAEVRVDVVGEAVEISVTDSGPGVSPAMREHLFSWGARGEQSHGQGIGLNIARQLAEEQGGYLTLRDGPRRGTTFVVGLPAPRVVAEDDHGAAAHIA